MYSYALQPVDANVRAYRCLVGYGLLFLYTTYRGSRDVKSYESFECYCG